MQVKLLLVCHLRVFRLCLILAPQSCTLCPRIARRDALISQIGLTRKHLELSKILRIRDKISIMDLDSSLEVWDLIRSVLPKTQALANHITFYQWTVAMNYKKINSVVSLVSLHHLKKRSRPFQHSRPSQIPLLLFT